jgi:hypothetical protein
MARKIPIIAIAYRYETSSRTLKFHLNDCRRELQGSRVRFNFQEIENVSRNNFLSILQFALSSKKNFISEMAIKISYTFLAPHSIKK